MAEHRHFTAVTIKPRYSGSAYCNSNVAFYFCGTCLLVSCREFWRDAREILRKYSIHEPTRKWESVLAQQAEIDWRKFSIMTRFPYFISHSWCSEQRNEKFHTPNQKDTPRASQRGFLPNAWVSSESESERIFVGCRATHDSRLLFCLFSRHVPHGKHSHFHKRFPQSTPAISRRWQSQTPDEVRTITTSTSKASRSHSWSFQYLLAQWKCKCIIRAEEEVVHKATVATTEVTGYCTSSEVSYLG